METTKRTKVIDPTLCAYCGRRDCTVGGTHGMLRERVMLAKRQIAEEAGKR